MDFSLNLSVILRYRYNSSGPTVATPSFTETNKLSARDQQSNFTNILRAYQDDSKAARPQSKPKLTLALAGNERNEGFSSASSTRRVVSEADREALTVDSNRHPSFSTRENRAKLADPSDSRKVLDLTKSGVNYSKFLESNNPSSPLNSKNNIQPSILKLKDIDNEIRRHKTPNALNNDDFQSDRIFESQRSAISTIPKDRLNNNPNSPSSHENLTFGHFKSNSTEPSLNKQLNSIELRIPSTSRSKRLFHFISSL